MNRFPSSGTRSLFPENSAGTSATHADHVRSRRFLLKLLGGSLVSGLPASATASAAGLPLSSNKGKTMKIVVLTGSPHRRGTSALLADEFMAGASARGHAIVRFDAAFEKVGPCLACYYCSEHAGECVQRDAMQKILPEILSADMIVLVTPLYFFSMTAQLKAVIDRMMPQRDALRQHPMKSAMLVTCGSDTSWNMDAIMAQYKALLRYLPWEDQGVVLAKHVFARKDIEGTEYPAAARALGMSL
ncbi:flavodoxin family protein [uncultured Desulfovibrio sp.]|uniref:flavodoxin family protein n=1 Tax=uncultured Desulfovibrio sp. TaxID=167968 RepID=UPI00261F6864|nr:flavodoxin family protein [uncultured Desulfovibrio sp.]